METIEIEFLEWVHPKLGVTAVQVEGGKPLVLKAKINPSQRQWIGLSDKERFELAVQTGAMSADWLPFMEAVEAKLKEKNT